MKNLNWDDLRIFLHVAENGGLTGAARDTGLSPATIGRRMLSLEQSTGQNLFDRSQTGYHLTKAGIMLQDRALAMQAASLPIQELLTDDQEKPTVRVSTGTYTAKFLINNISTLSNPHDSFRLNFLTSEATLDITHRETDLGIRGQEPASGNLASRKLGTIRFAPYCSWSIKDPASLGWIAIDPELVRYPSAKWLQRQNPIVTAFTSSPAMVHELIRAGAGIGVMPCMIADCDPNLKRCGDPIDELTSTQYLVMHNEDRSRPATRRVIDRISKLYQDHQELIAGHRPMRF